MAVLPGSAHAVDGGGVRVRRQQQAGAGVQQGRVRLQGCGRPRAMSAHAAQGYRPVPAQRCFKCFPCPCGKPLVLMPARAVGAYELYEHMQWYACMSAQRAARRAGR